MLLVLLFTIPARATDLSYSSLVPQTSDNDLILLHKSQVSVGKLANGNLVSNITASGTNSVTAVVLERIVVNTAGSADSAAILKSGSTTLATLSTGAQASIAYNVVIASGTLTVISSGTTAPNLTLSYR